MVNVAFDAPVDFAPRDQIEDAERRLYDLAEIGRYGGGFQKFETALTTAVDMAARAYQRDGKLSGLATGLRDLDSKMGGLQSSDLIIVAGRPGMGKTALATNIAYNVARAWRGEVQADGHISTVNGGIVGFFSLEMSAEQLATRIIAEQSGIPSSTIRRGGINERDFEKIKDVAIELQHLPFFIDETGGLTVAQLAARARRLKRQKGLDLLVIDYIQLLRARPPLAGKPRAGGDRDHHQPQGAGQGAQRADHGAVAALAPGREPRRQAAAALRPARIRLDRAGRRRGDVRVPRGILPEQQGAAARHRRAYSSGRPRWPPCTARPRSSSASSATARPAPSTCSSTPRSRASTISRATINCPEQADPLLIAAILVLRRAAPRAAINARGASQTRVERALAS